MFGSILAGRGVSARACGGLRQEWRARRTWGKALSALTILLTAWSGPALAQSAGCTAINNGALNHDVRRVAANVSSVGTTANYFAGQESVHNIQTQSGGTDPTYGTAPFGSGYSATPLAAGEVIVVTAVTSNFASPGDIVGVTLRGTTNNFSINSNGTASSTYTATGSETYFGIRTWREGGGASADIAFSVTCTPATPSVYITVSPASVSEDGATNLTYTVTRSAVSASPLTVNLTTSGTATSGVDYTGAAVTVTIAANATTATVVLNPTVDGTVEANETVTLTVASGTGYTVGAPSSATGTILNDDVPSATIAVSPASVAEDGAPNLVYTVTLNQASLSSTSVNYTISGTATNGTDYATIASPLVIPAGNTSGAITVNPSADATIEANETVILTLGAGAGYTVGVPNAATGTILNDDLPNLTVNNVTASEGNAGTSNFTFTVSLSAPAGPGGVTFDIATANGTATGGADYVSSSLSGQTIPAGASTYTFTVLVNGDAANEPSETYFVNVTNVANAIVVDGQGLGTIVNDDPIPSLSINDVTVTEGDAGTASAVFTVALSAPSGQSVTVNYATANGTAFAGLDYTAASGTLTFAPGDTTRTVSVTVAGDTTVEADETFTVGLSGATNATISDSSGIGTVANDDVPTATIAVSPASVSEDGATNLVYTVTLNQASPGSISIGYSISGTATNGTDYATIASPLVIPAGNTTGAITVNPTADATVEANETVTLTLGAGAGYTVGVPNAATGTILNDDLPNLTVNDVTASEGNAGTTNFTFTVSLSAPAGPGGVTFDIATANGTSTGGVDYAAQTLASQTIPAGSSTYSFTVQVNGDTLNEPNETYFVNVTNVVNATVVDGQGVGTIVNDDLTPSLSINDVTVTEGDAGTVSAVFTVTLSAASGQSVTVNYATADDSALAGADYTAASGTLTFAPGDTTRTVVVLTSGDAVYEETERFALNLSGATNATISVAQGLGTIANDDARPSFTVNDVSIAEGDSGTSALTFTVTRTGATALSADVSYTTANGTATAPDDYAVTAGVLPFGPSLSPTSTQTVSVPINGDTTFEPNETLFLNLTSSTSHGQIGDSQGIGTITNDDVAPPSVTSLSPATGPATGGTVVMITGLNLSGATAVAFGGNAATAVTVNSATSITATAPAGSAGAVEVTVTTAGGVSATAGAGNDYTYVAIPSAPVITTPPNGSTTADNTPTYAGTAPAGSTVNLVVDGVPAGTTTATAGGNWSFTSVTALADGPHTVVSTATTIGGTSPNSATSTFTVDSTAPTSPVIAAPVDGSITADSTPTISGTAEANSTVTVIIDGVVAGTTTAAGSGAWSFTSAALADGAHTVRATGTDMSGNVSASSSNTNFTVDAAAPGAPVISTPVNGSTTADNTPTIIGTAEANATVTVIIDGITAGTASADGAGAWSLTSAALADGVHTVRATATDAAGNVSPASVVTGFTVDASAPAAPVISAPVEGSTSSDNTPAISGTAEAGATVTIVLDGVAAGTVTADGSGAWSFTSAALTDGAHAVRATATDAVGNVSAASGTTNFAIDASAPVAPVISAPVNGSTTADNTPTVSGATEAGATVTVIIDGVAAGTTLADGSGAWTLTLPLLADGAHTVRATATDAVGNASPPSATVSFTVDATAPAAPVISSPADGSVTDDGAPTISGTAENGSTVRLTVNGAGPVSVTVSGGTWSYTPPSSLPAGQNTLSAVAVDPAGNVSAPSAVVRFTYSPVTITTTSLPSGQVGAAYAVAIQASGGTGPYGFVVTSGALPDGVTMSGGGALSGVPTASGTFGFTVTATDANGLSTSQSYSVTIAAPAAPEADPETVQITSAAAGGPTTIDLSGSVDNAASIEIVSQPSSGTATVNGFQVVYTPQPGFYGSVVFSYRAIGFSDGGPGAASAPATVTITIAPPTLALAGGAQPSGRIGVTYSQVLTASGGTAPYTYAVTSGALPAGLTLAVDGTLSGSPTAGGSFSFTVTATDSSTGTGPFSVSAVHDLIIDGPALVVTPTTLPDAITAQPYSRSFSTTGGVAPYSYAVTGGALPTGLTLSPAGLLSGTPTQGGSFTFIVSATDASTGAGPYTAAQSVTLTVAASAITVTPTTLAAGARGTPYTADMVASGGVGPYSYAIASGALPAGLTLSSTGRISGTPTAVGTFAFQVRATDSATGAGPYAGVADVTLTIGSATLTVTPASLPDVLAGVPYSQQLQASGGQGGYTFAVTAGVLPQGLTLSPAGLLAGRPTMAGTFTFTVTATDGFGNTGAASLSVTVTGRPDPSADPDVRGLNTAQAEATRRMVGTQLQNFHRRLEQLHRGGEGQSGASMNLTLDGSAFTPLDEGRRTMGELSQVLGREDAGDRDLAGRDELNRMVWGDRAEGGGSAQGGSAQDGLNVGQPGGAGTGAASGLRIWAGGAITLGERDATTQTADMSITTSGISAGVDVSLAPNLDLGIGVGFGQENTDVGSDSSRMEADSRLAVAYGSWRPGEDVFVDGVFGYGELGFDTRRRTPVDQGLVYGQRDGTAVFGSLSAGLDRIDGSARWITYGRVEVLNADLDAYAETGSPIWALSYEARSVESLQGALGLRYEREILRGYDVWTPGVRLEWTHEFGDAAAQTLRYADWLDGPGFLIGQEGWERSRLNLGLSLGWRSRNGWSWSGEYDGAFSNGEILNGLRIRGRKAF